MLKLDNLISKLEFESFPYLSDLYSQDIKHIISDIRGNIIYICDNNFYYFKNGNLSFQTTCITGMNGFGCEKGSFKTPIGLHYISDFIGDNSDKYQKFVARFPTCIVSPVKHMESKPGVYGRIIRLDGVEDNNKNTSSRGIYIHGNIHHWYWSMESLKSSKGCIGLKLEEIVYIFDLLKNTKRKVFVYIEEQKMIL